MFAICISILTITNIQLHTITVHRSVHRSRQIQHTISMVIPSFHTKQSWSQIVGTSAPPRKNGERGKLGQERLEVSWEVVMFLFNIVNLNV